MQTPYDADDITRFRSFVDSPRLPAVLLNPDSFHSQGSTDTGYVFALKQTR